MDCLSKVKKHPMFVDDDLSSQQSQARNLVDLAKIKERFAHLLDMKQFLDNIREGDDCSLTHSTEINQHREQQKMDTAQAGYLPVKLFLSKLRGGTPPAAGPLTTLLRFKYGPLHAGLIVGDICIEWDDSSLIVPLPEPDVPESEFIAHIEDRGSFRQRCGQLVRDMSMANRRNMGTPAKLDIINKTRAEKDKLLNRLTELIVKYNQTKKYSVFKCNCQHFVTEALEALHIRDAPKFEGNLGEYFNALKRGKAAGLQFESHAELDDYVKAHSDTLDKDAKEYLLCLYFQFHAAELGRLTPEEQERWECQLASCQCQELEYQVEREYLFFHEFSRQQSVAYTPPVIISGARLPGMPIVPEVVEEEAVGPRERREEIKEDAARVGEDTTDHAILEGFLDRKDSKELQVQRLEEYSRSGYSNKVMDKLKTHPEYQDKTEDELKRVAEILSEREQFRQEYLSDLLINETSMNVVQKISEEEQESKDHPLPPEEVGARAKDRYEELFNIKMNIIVRICNRGDSKTDAARAPVRLGLQVGDYVYEWNQSGLIIPKQLQEVGSEPRLLSPVLQKSDWCGVVSKEKKKVEQSIEETIRKKDYSMQFKIHFELTKKRDQFLVAFIDTVIRYNRTHVYNRASRNDKTFLAAAVKSLGIEKPGKVMCKSIKEHINQLKASKSISRKPMETHDQLDAIVAEMAEDSLSKEDTEYLIAKYYLLHVEEWEREGERSSDKWQCSVESCRLGKLERLLIDLTSITTT